jgi:2-phosphoglycerate kinase
MWEPGDRLIIGENANTGKKGIKINQNKRGTIFLEWGSMGSLLANMERKWEVLLIGGASGTGKTSVSYRVARHFGVGITEVDDFQVILERMTTPEQLPPLHYWRTHPGFFEEPAEAIVRQLIDVGEVMHPALEAVIANHLESRAPVVLEGDFLLPALAAQLAFGAEANAGRVRAVFLVEEDELQLRQNYLRREPQSGEQVKRARVSWLYGQWLMREAERAGLPVVPARPWENVFERVLAALQD